MQRVSTEQVPCAHKEADPADYLHAATKTLEPLQGQKQAQTCGLEESARSGMERLTFWKQLLDQFICMLNYTLQSLTRNYVVLGLF